MTKLIQNKIDQCSRYTLTLENLIKEIEKDKSIIQDIVSRTKVVKEGLTKLQIALDEVQVKKDQIKPKQVENMIVVEKILTHIDSWPLCMHLFTGTFCLGCSAAFHLMQIQSQTISNYLARLDYSGISILIMGSSFPVLYYVFQCGPVHFYRYIFISLISSTSFLTFIMMLLPCMNKPKWRMCRALSFIFLGLSAGLPFIFIVVDKSQNERFYLPTRDALIWLYGGLVYIAGALLYGFKIPEKFFSYKFDLVGASHQIFHVAVIAGFFIHFTDAVRLYHESQTFVCPVEIGE